MCWCTLAFVRRRRYCRLLRRPSREVARSPQIDGCWNTDGVYCWLRIREEMPGTSHAAYLNMERWQQEFHDGVSPHFKYAASPTNRPYQLLSFLRCTHQRPIRSTGRLVAIDTFGHSFQAQDADKGTSEGVRNRAVGVDDVFGVKTERTVCLRMLLAFCSLTYSPERNISTTARSIVSLL